MVHVGAVAGAFWTWKASRSPFRIFSVTKEARAETAAAPEGILIVALRAKANHYDLLLIIVCIHYNSISCIHIIYIHYDKSAT